MDKVLHLAQNPWKQGRTPAPPTIRRDLASALETALEAPEIVTLLGARQTGKTTLLVELARRALASGRYPPDLVHYLDLDTQRCEDVLATNRATIDFLGIRAGDPSTPPRLLLIDEVQRLDSPGLLLKSLYDLGLPIKIVVTGSSSLEIRSRVRESLAGRSLRYHLWPLSHAESRQIPSESLESYLRWGGYPAIVLEHDAARKQQLLANLFAAYLDRDIGDFLRVENLNAFQSFTALLAHQVGQLVNLNELSNTLGVSRDTLSRYLTYLESTFVVRVLRPFVANRRSELTKMPKVYFADLGLRNLLVGRIAAPADAQDRGVLFESLVEILLRLDSRTEDLFFWRTRGGAEVDFVWRAGGHLYAIEVKAASFSRPAVPRSLASFIASHSPRRAAVVCFAPEAEVERSGVPVRFIPPERVCELADD